MRYSPAHAAKSGSVPFMLRGPKSLRTVMTTAVAGIIGLVPTVLIASPAHAVVVDGSYTIADASGAEGGYVTFRITRAAPTGTDTLDPETVHWTAAVGGGTASTGDFTVASGDVSFGANTGSSTQSRTISVLTTQDTADEADETFTVTLTNTLGSPNAVLDDDEAVGTIVDDDNPTYTLSSTPITVNESASDVNRHATIKATLSAPSLHDITIPVETVEGTAKSGADFEPVNDVITIQAGDPSGSIPVEVTDDDIDEPDLQSFSVKTSAGTNVTGTQTVTVNIADNDAAPTIEIGSPGAQLEGQVLTFPVTLSDQSENTITANWTTADLAAEVGGHGIAKAGADYTAASGTVTFAPLAAEPTTPIKVTTLTDELDELSPEDFNVKLSSVQNATLSTTDHTAVGGITDSGAYLPPQVVLTPEEITEGNPATAKTRTFTVSLTRASGQAQEVDYAVAPGAANAPAGIGIATTAGANADFTDPADGTLKFAPGELSKTFTVDIMGDNMDEGNGENIAITLTDGLGGVLTDGRSMGTTQVTIKDDDAKPVLSVTKPDITMPETDGPAAALYEVKLSNPSDHDVDWTVAPTGTSSATTGPGAPGHDDYTLLSPTGGNGSVMAGQTSSYVLVVVNGDEVFEPDEIARWTVTRDSDDYATGGPVTTSLTLTDDDPAPQLEVVSDDVTEGQTVALNGVVTGVAQAQTTLSVTLAGKSMGGKQAASATDFSPATFQVPITGGTASGSTVAIGTVVITDDTTAEPAETILASGTGFGNTGSVKDGVLTILASDGGSTDPTDPTDPDVEAPTLKASSSIRIGRGSITLSGTAAAGQTVDLWGKNLNAEDYVKLSSTTVASGGTFSFARGLNTYGMEFVAAIGDKQSDPVQVIVRQDPVFTLTSPSRGVVRITVTGDPKVAGLTTKVFQAKTGGGYVTVGTGKLSATGTYTYTVTGLKSGKSYRFWAQVLGNAERGIATGYAERSQTITVR